MRQFWSVVFLLFLVACYADQPVAVTTTVRATQTTAVSPTPQVNTTAVSETAVTPIPLASPLTDADAEISGLAWYNDTLILLPQYPNFSGGRESFIYALPRAGILAYLDGHDPEPLQPQPVPFAAPGLAQEISGFEGYEAIAFNEDTVYLTVEANPLLNGMKGYLVQGTMAPNLAELVVDTSHIVEILPQSSSSNKSDEALFVAGDTIVTIYEVNGAALNPNPVAHRFDEDLNEIESVPFPTIEYRMTDTTALDENGRFWVINYFFPGDSDLQVEVDPLAEQYDGRGSSHRQEEHVERLIELQYSENGISFTDTPPIQLSLTDEARNWEGIVRLNGRGFLIVTDKFPETILGVVPGPTE